MQLNSITITLFSITGKHVSSVTALSWLYSSCCLPAKQTKVAYVAGPAEGPRAGQRAAVLPGRALDPDPHLLHRHGTAPYQFPSVAQAHKFIMLGSHQKPSQQRRARMHALVATALRRRDAAGGVTRQKVVQSADDRWRTKPLLGAPHPLHRAHSVADCPLQACT